jgi:hypothetical protein
MKTFKPRRKNLHPNIIATFEKKMKWHISNGYIKAGELTIDEILKKYIGLTNGTFMILVQDCGKRFHDNATVMVFNKDGVLIDDRVYFNPRGNEKIPKKAFIGTPIIDGSKPMKFKPAKNEDKSFRPPF